MNVTTSLTMTGEEAAQVSDLIKRLSAPTAKRTWKADPRSVEAIKYSAFPDSGRMIFFVPTFQGKVAVMELPVDDPSPTTMINIMARPLVDGRWKIEYSPKAHASYQKIRSALGISTTPDIERYYVPTYTAYPFDLNINGQVRSKLQVHGVSSTPISKRTKQLDPCSGGAYCNVLGDQPMTKDDNGSWVTHGVSLGCAFVSAVDKLHDTWDHKQTAILHVGGISNTFFSYQKNADAGILGIFNFEVDDPVFASAFSTLNQQFGDTLSLIDVLRWYSSMVVKQYGNK